MQYFLLGAYTGMATNLIINPLWLIYDIIVFSLAGILSDAFTIISIVIAMIRLDRKRKSKSDLTDGV